MIRAASLPIEVNLQSLSQILQKQGLAHRINEESGQQVIWVRSEQEAQLIRQVLANWSPEAHQGSQPQSGTADKLVSAAALWRLLRREFIASPITLGLILLCLLVALLSGLGSQAERVSFLFYPSVAADNLFVLLRAIASPSLLLRSLTPMFLHFGDLHLIFNMLWLWYFGKQLETIHPRWVFVGIILIISFVSNTTQFMSSGYNNFGGMSGVVYGLLGYTWVIHSFMPRSYLLLNNRMFVVFVIALVVMELVASTWIATAAHVGGLLSGLLLGMAMVIYYRLLLKQERVGRSR